MREFGLRYIEAKPHYQWPLRTATLQRGWETNVSVQALMKKLRVFLVEDNPIILLNLTQALEELAGVQVVGSAADESTALKWLDGRTNGCDVVILDIFLLSGSGLGVLRGMQTYEAPPYRVVLTNYTSPEIRDKCYGLGAQATFDKSKELDELISWLTLTGGTLH